MALYPGQVLVHKFGNFCASATVADDGRVAYGGRLYRDLDAAGLRAMRDHGARGSSCDGWDFWRTKSGLRLTRDD